MRDEVADGLRAVFGPAAAEGYRATARTRFAASLAHPDVTAYEAFHAGRFAGMVMTFRESDERAEIAFLHVLAQDGGRGVGPALVRTAVEALRADGVRTIRADSLTFGQVDLDGSFLPLGFVRRERLLMGAPLEVLAADADDGGSKSQALAPEWDREAGETLYEAYKNTDEPALHWEVANPREAGVFVRRVRDGAFGRVESEFLRWIPIDGVMAGVALGAEVLADTGFILQVAVKPAFRGRGLARGLLRDLFASFRRADLHWAALTVNADNPARNLYEGLGMKERSPKPAYVWRGGPQP